MKNITIALLTLIIIVSISACNNTEHKAPETLSKVTYKTMSLQTRAIGNQVRLPGIMQPYLMVQIFPKVNGFIKSIDVDRGSLVKQGQVLMTLDAPELQQQVMAAYQRYTQAYANYLTGKDRYNRLLTTSATPGTVSAFDLQAAASKMQADSALAQGEYASYQAQQAMKSYLTITAPFSGVITERNVHPGALVGPTVQNAKPMLLLQQTSKMRLVTDVPEQYATQIKDNEPITFTVNALPGQKFNDRISRTSGSLNNSYRTETIEIDVDNTVNHFQPGMYAEVTLPVIGNVQAFAVPRSAIVTTTERKYVVVVTNGIAKWIDIRQGNENNDSTEIFGNLHVGDNVITNADYHIKDGAGM